MKICFVKFNDKENGIGSGDSSYEVSEAYFTVKHVLDEIVNKRIYMFSFTCCCSSHDSLKLGYRCTLRSALRILWPMLYW